MAERYLQPDDPIVQMFIALPFDEVAELRIRALTPTTVDDGTRSHTPGPIEAYALRARATQAQHVGRVVIWIADGNHRYFEHVRQGHTIIAARRVIPDQEHDIRYMFDVADRWEEI